MDYRDSLPISIFSSFVVPAPGMRVSWRRGSKDPRDQGFKGLFSKDFISAFNIFSISAMSFLLYPIHLFLYISKQGSYDFAKLSILCNSLALCADCCALRLEKIHFVSLEPLNP